MNIRPFITLLLCVCLTACQARAPDMNANKIDWQSLDFTCTHEQPPPFDPEAGSQYRTARNLKKRDEEAFATEIVALYRQAIDKNHYNAMHRLALLHIEGMSVGRGWRGRSHD